MENPTHNKITSCISMYAAQKRIMIFLSLWVLMWIGKYLFGKWDNACSIDYPLCGVSRTGSKLLLKFLLIKRSRTEYKSKSKPDEFSLIFFVYRLHV